MIIFNANTKHPVRMPSFTITQLVHFLVCHARKRGWKLEDVTVRLHQAWHDEEAKFRTGKGH